MYEIIRVLLLAAWLVCTVNCQCRNANWWTSFDKKGYSTCPVINHYINGLYRSDGKKQDISLIEQARCCPCPSRYRNEPTQCLAADWVSSFDKNSQWSYCPRGFFLRGLYRSVHGGKGLHNIEYGKCCKPARHPYYWGHCYDQDVSVSFDRKGLSKCKNGYFITGFYRSSCDKLYCIEKFRCCQMVQNPPILQSLADVKTRVLDVTMYDLSKLAHYLGYGWCAGCRAQYVGEDFRRNGDRWEADKKGPCKGFKANHRLKIHYGDFKFGIKDIKYGKQVIQSLQPSVFDSGRVDNADATPVVHTVEREIQSVRTVTHTTTSSWKKTHELGVEISYTPSSATGGLGGKIHYKFNYESSRSTTDSTNNQQVNIFKVLSRKTIPPRSAAKWQIMVSNTRTTVAYTAVVLVHFSAKLDGFLRWGGGANGKSTNYHYKHKGKTSRPTVPYRFGGKSVPFYKALKQQSTQNIRPWLWNDMKNRYSPAAQAVINNLINEGRYEFTLAGQFEDVVGHRADFRWQATPLRTKRSAQESLDEENQSSQHKDDPPRVFPPPPKVTIHKGKYKKGHNHLKILGN